MAADPEDSLIVYVTTQHPDVRDVATVGDVTSLFVQTHMGDAGVGHKFLNDGRTVLLLTCGSTAGDTLTVTSERTCAFGVSHGTTFECTASKMHVLGPFSTRHFNDSTGYVHVEYEATAADNLVLAVSVGSPLG